VVQERALGTRAGLRLMAKVLEMPLLVAVSVAVVAEETAATVAEKLAEVAPAATVTDAGTVTAPELLARLTPKPPAGAAAVNVTVHASVPVLV